MIQFRKAHRTLASWPSSNSQLTLDASLTNLEAANETWLLWARSLAQTLSALNGSVTSDDLREAADLTGLVPDSPHAWGAVFIGKQWRCLDRIRSRYASNNGRYISRWRYEQGAP